MRYCVDAAEQQYNVVTVDLAPDVAPPPETAMRNVLTTSACGVCGTASLQALQDRGISAVGPGLTIDADVLRDPAAASRSGAAGVRPDRRPPRRRAVHITW